MRTEPAAGDFHLYATPDTLVSQFNKFDNITTPHVIGEVAAVVPNGADTSNGLMMPWPWWGGAVGEAVSLVGYERNQDRIIGAAYVSIIEPYQIGPRALLLPRCATWN